MESMTDCAFSWPISMGAINKAFAIEGSRHTLVVIDNIAQVVFAVVVCLADTHRIVGEIYIAIIAFERKSAVYSETNVAYSSLGTYRRVRNGQQVFGWRLIQGRLIFWHC